MRDSAPLSPLEPAATPVATEKQQGPDRANADKDKDQQPGRVSVESSNLQPQSPKAEDKVEEDDEDGGPLTISELTYRSAQSPTTNISNLSRVTSAIQELPCDVALWQLLFPEEVCRVQ